MELNDAREMTDRRPGRDIGRCLGSGTWFPF